MEDAFVPATEAAGLMRAYGNLAGPRLVGLVVPIGPASWVAEISFIKDGFVEDADAKGWNADSLLAGLKEGTEAANQDRIARGYTPMDVLGWIEPPSYDASTHRLIWSIASIERGGDATLPNTVNYNTYPLGRDGYFSLDLITSSTEIEADKPIARLLLQNLNYQPGRKYEDYKPGTDHLAEYGLAALVGGVALKKLGLLALAGVFLLKIWKIGLLAIFGITAGLRRWLKSRAQD